MSGTNDRDADREHARTAPKRYPNAIDPILGYAPGTILTDDLADFCSVRVAEHVLLHRYRKEGFDGVKNVMMLSDNCALPVLQKGPRSPRRMEGT